MTNMDIKELESVNGAGIDKVSGGDGTEMIPRSDKPRCPDCGSENVVVVYTMVDSKTKKKSHRLQMQTLRPHFQTYNV